MKSIAFAGVLLAASLTLASCKANDSSPTSNNMSGGTAPAVFGKFVSTVQISVDGSIVVLQSKGTPNHTSPYWGSGNALYEAPHTGMVVNPNRIIEQNLVFRIPLNPSAATTITATQLGPIGIAVNGVALYNQYAAGNAPLTNEIQTFDRYNGHPQQVGQYHYHIEPQYLTRNDSSLVGFLLDGFPLYGKKDMDGSVPANLDAANGHVAATIDYPNGIYHYHVTDTVPYICGGFKGTPGTVSQ